MKCYFKVMRYSDSIAPSGGLLMQGGSDLLAACKEHKRLVAINGPASIFTFKIEVTYKEL